MVDWMPVPVGVVVNSCASVWKISQWTSEPIDATSLFEVTSQLGSYYPYSYPTTLSGECTGHQRVHSTAQPGFLSLSTTLTLNCPKLKTLLTYKLETTVHSFVKDIDDGALVRTYSVCMCMYLVLHVSVVLFPLAHASKLCDHMREQIASIYGRQLLQSQKSNWN